MAERLVISIEVGDEAGKNASVEDVFVRLIDVFHLAVGDDDTIVWSLVQASTNTPLTIVAEAHSVDPTIPVDLLAQRQEERFVTNLHEVQEGRLPREWSGKPQRRRLQAITQSTRIVTRASVRFESDRIRDRKPAVKPLELTRETLERVATILDSDPDGLPSLGPVKPQVGSIEGNLLGVTTWYGHPALQVVDRFTGDSIICVVSEEDRRRIAEAADFDDVWSGRRVRVGGLIEYDNNRIVRKVTATSVDLLDVRPVDMSRLTDHDFAGGKSPEEYLEQFREGNN